MNTRIEITFANPDALQQTVTLSYVPMQTPIARKYVTALHECEVHGRTIIDPDRFHNFPGSKRDRYWIANRINTLIDVVNAHHPDLIEQRADPHMDQVVMNTLHHYFELHRGPVLNPSAVFVTAPPQVKAAIEELNLLIHRYEDFDRTEKNIALGYPTSPHAVMTFDYTRPRYDLADEDYTHFTLVYLFGSLRINYCEVGKPIWDYYRDQDEIIGDDNIRPLRYYSADATLGFGPTTEPKTLAKRTAQFWAWWDERADALAKFGFHKGDPKLAIGHINVATLDRDFGAIRGLSDTQLVQLLADHQLLVSARVLDLDTLASRVARDPTQRAALIDACGNAVRQQLGLARDGDDVAALGNAVLGQAVASLAELDDVIAALEPWYQNHRHQNDATDGFMAVLRANPDAVYDVVRGISRAKLLRLRKQLGSRVPQPVKSAVRAALRWQ